MNQTREWANRTSGILGFIIPTYFAWTVYQNNIPQNIATWGMILLLDVLGLALVYKEGNKEPYLQIGWVLAAICIVSAIVFGDNLWHWGWAESASLALCGAAIILWLILNARVAIWAQVAAMFISVIPLMIDYWHIPQPDTLWLWLSTIGTCLLAIYGTSKRDFMNTVIPWAALILNGIIAVLCVS